MTYSNQELGALGESYKKELFENVLPFWYPKVLDRKYGGYLVCRDREGELLDDDKPVWQQGRFSWLLSTLYNTVEKNEDWLEAAHSGLEFLEEHCFDKRGDGRMFFHVCRDGSPIRKRRYYFSECFASLAYASYARAAQNEEAKKRAMELFEKSVDYYLHPEKLPAKTTGVRSTRSIGPAMILINVAQQLRENFQYESADHWIQHFVEDIKTYFIKPEINCVMEQVGQNGEILDHFDQRTLNPGHAIECAWFIMHEGKIKQDDELILLGVKMLDWMWTRGWDKKHGGILYFTDVYHKPVQEYWHDMKFWWPNIETEIACLLAFKLTGNPKYAERHRMIRKYNRSTFEDRDCGEWFGYSHKDGRLSSTIKGNLWKGPFHLPRMLWYCAELLK